MNGIVKIIVLAVVLGAAYWYFSPYQNCKRAYADNPVGDKGVEIVCADRSW